MDKGVILKKKKKSYDIVMHLERFALVVCWNFLQTVIKSILQMWIYFHVAVKMCK